MKETAFTSREVINALVEYAQKYKGLPIKKTNAMWRKNPDFSVILTTEIKGCKMEENKENEEKPAEPTVEEEKEGSSEETE